MTPTMIRQLVGARLNDILFPCLIDEDTQPADHMLVWRQVYLQLKERLVELRCIGDTGIFSVNSVQTFSEVPWNSEGWRQTQVSLSEPILAHHGTPIAKVTLIGPAFDAQTTTCSAMELRFEGGQILFFDPTYIFGFRVGGAEQRTLWLENWPGAETLAVWDTSA